MFKRAYGFSLIEVMISIVLGVIIVFATVEVMINNRMLTDSEKALSRIQESGRLALNIITREVRRVGYHGCSNPADMRVVEMATDVVSFADTSLRGFEVNNIGDFSPALIPGDALLAIQNSPGGPSARSGSDVIQVKYAGRPAAELIVNTAASSMTVDDNPAQLEIGDLAVIANCKSAHIFRITDLVPGAGGAGGTLITHGSADNNPATISPGYSVGAELLAYQDVTLFVADTGRDIRGTDVYALYQIVNGGAPQELVEGVEFLQILYGQRVSSNSLRFVSADEMGINMRAIESIKVSFLIQDFTRSRIEEDATDYTLNNVTISPASTGTNAGHSGDRYLRKVFSATVELRNVRTNVRVL